MPTKNETPSSPVSYCPRCKDEIQFGYSLCFAPNEDDTIDLRITPCMECESCGISVQGPDDMIRLAPHKDSRMIDVLHDAQRLKAAWDALFYATYGSQRKAQR